MSEGEGGVWRELYGFVYAYLRRQGLSHADAEDLAQDVLEAAFRHLDSVEPGRLRAWLEVVARNRLIDRARRKETGVVLGDVPERSSSEPGPLETLIAAADAEEVRAALSTLGERDRLLVAQRYLEGRSVAEVAELSGLSVTATKVALYRARGRLRAALEEEDR